MKSNSVYFAEVGTSHFSFKAIGATRDEAIKTLMSGWRVHKVQTGATAGNTSIRESINVMRMEYGRAYRDFTTLPVETKPVSRDTVLLAESFTSELIATIGIDKMVLVRARNRKETCPGGCHSHDFCDANMVMSAAWFKCFGTETDPSNDADAALWNAAWDLAKKNQFTTREGDDTK